MSSNLDHLFAKNAEWAARMEEERPGFFKMLSYQQTPEYLWIGCSDSRVPANELMGLLPGEVFVHRNIANLVIHSDLNAISVIHFAVRVLKVKHIIVCGHYGCGGVKAAMENGDLGLIDNWLRHIKDTYYYNQQAIHALPVGERLNRLCEINVVEQVAHISHMKAVQNAWANGQDLAIHGWIYGIEDGLLRNLNVTRDNLESVDNIYSLNPTAFTRED
ncbi:carbonate dehydratase [Pokkaliibacter plantistimulans]|uniref:carbonic anhydrase n=1 Tax=Pokkaliibacter plantistimulans TaxID=1635171 RepID=A0ABX5M0R5_9GAMM|nr:carbonate dehydratase [Pokkaliibacter plantistimulans]PXF31535.1 carbonate dehydratase [Pokkaliibacter plantistimulans]